MSVLGRMSVGRGRLSGCVVGTGRRATQAAAAQMADSKDNGMVILATNCLAGRPAVGLVGGSLQTAVKTVGGQTDNQRTGCDEQQAVAFD